MWRALKVEGAIEVLSNISFQTHGDPHMHCIDIVKNITPLPPNRQDKRKEGRKIRVPEVHLFLTACRRRPGFFTEQKYPSSLQVWMVMADWCFFGMRNAILFSDMENPWFSHWCNFQTNIFTFEAENCKVIVWGFYCLRNKFESKWVIFLISTLHRFL